MPRRVGDKKSTLTLTLQGTLHTTAPALSPYPNSVEQIMLGVHVLSSSRS